MVDFYEYSTPELVKLLGNRFKEYRIRCNLTQKDVSEQSGIGLTTIHKLPESPYLMRRDDKKVQRVRHSK